MRARRPDASSFAVRDGVHVHYETFGSGPRTVLFLPAWSIVHSRLWKAQVAHFSRFARVVTFDGRGNGLSDRGPGLDYSDDAFVLDALAVLDATQTQRATVVGLSSGGWWGVVLAARYPERIERLICIAPAAPFGPRIPERAAAAARFDRELPSYDRWDKLNRHYWKSNYKDFLQFFFEQCLPEPHSTKQLEDAVSWGLETTPETLAATLVAPSIDAEEATRLARSIRCPVLVLHGDDDRIVPHARGEAVAQATGGKLLTLRGSGHLPQARIPVAVNVAIADFAGLTPPPRQRRSKKKRVLFVSSPIGLGHAQRDLAIAQELRRIRADIEISWLAQHPVTAVLQASGEPIHPASAMLVNESAHFENECAEHDLHAFEAIRRMDEIMVANFMVFHELVSDERYDLVVGDEAWDIDHFLHEHPERKRTAFAWLTDFVGWIPMPDGGEAEAKLTRDYNLEMIEHIDRSPRLRDRSIFVGDREDVVAERFAPDLPFIADWMQAHYDFPGYVTGFSPPSDAERQSWRRELGYRPDEIVCIVTVGGSGAGTHLLRRILAAFPEVKRRIPAMRMIAVAGPRIDPAAFVPQRDLEIHAFVPRLYRHLAACDIALVQGGLTTTMELTASQRPFVFFPLRHHFEQNFHVRHRLARHRAGRAMDYDAATPPAIAEAVEAELCRAIDYVPVRGDGALKAGRLIGEMV